MCDDQPDGEEARLRARIADLEAALFQKVAAQISPLPPARLDYMIRKDVPEYLLGSELTERGAAGWLLCSVSRNKDKYTLFLVREMQKGSRNATT